MSVRSVSLHIASVTVLVAVAFASTASAEEPSPLPYLSNDIVAGAIVRPADLLESSHVKTVLEKSGLETLLFDELKEMGDELGVDIRQIEELAILFDERTVKRTLGIPDAVARSMELKQIALAFHNFHDVYLKFPDDDGIEDDGNKGNLSWRVHLLPFLEEARLYQQFHLDEPWDSDHNKALIDQMPEIFASPGVDDPTKTSLHVFTAPGAPFGDDAAPRIRDFTDGTSNTILAIMAGPTTADVWTKPGGLDVEPATAADEIGLDDDPLQVVLADGSAKTIVPDIDPVLLQYLIEHQDNEIIDFAEPAASSQRTPILYLRSTNRLNQSRVVGGMLGDVDTAVKSEIDNVVVYTRKKLLVAFPDELTFLAGPADIVESLLKKPATGLLFEQLHQAGDGEIRFGADIRTIDDGGAPRLPRIRMNLMFGGEFLAKIRTIRGHVDFAGNNKTLISMFLGTDSERDAAMIGPLLQGLIQLGKAQLLAAAATGRFPLTEEELAPLPKLVDLIAVETDAEQVHIHMTRPNMDKLLTELEPALSVMKDILDEETQRRKRRAELMPMKEILLAFHNHHDVYSQFPNHNSGAGEFEDNNGLSWRVHLLPFLGFAGLHSNFHLDEPWDSDHNKALIEKMPDVFSVKGVNKPGYTTYHVFVGDDAPFSDDGEAPRIRNFTDGTSNTLLVVRAGRETAAPWTKPGGIKFTGEDVLKSLGTFGTRLLIGRCDGSSQFIDVEDLDDESLHDFITPGGGELFDAF